MVNATTTRKILVVYYTQTGQLGEMVRAVISPLAGDPSMLVREIRLEPLKPFPFPWHFFDFFDVFPECVSLDPPPLKALPDNINDDYDLIVLGYQPWYLSPSLPTTAFLQGPISATLMQGKPVMTVIACRNMWLKAHEQVKGLIAANGGHLIDNIVFVDQGSAAQSFVTTVRWMLTGRKDRFLGVFPPAGVAESELPRARAYGVAIGKALHEAPGLLDAPVLADLRPVSVNQANLLAETFARRSFRVWGWLMRRLGPPGHLARKPILLLYALFLGIAIITVIPVVSLALAVFGRFSMVRFWLDRWAARFMFPYSL